MLRLLVASWAGNTSAAQNEQPMNDMNLQYWYIMFYNNLLTYIRNRFTNEPSHCVYYNNGRKCNLGDDLFQYFLPYLIIFWKYGNMEKVSFKKEGENQ